LSAALTSEFKDYFYLIEYDDLVSKPKKAMDKVYDFLGIETFDHNLEDIQRVEIENDLAYGLNPTMHEVRPQLSESKTDPAKVLTEYGLRKYSGLEFWREGSPISIKGRDF
jgi:hypothetical protein